jgi:hypothetical protein
LVSPDATTCENVSYVAYVCEVFASTRVHPDGAVYVFAAPPDWPLFQKLTTRRWPAAGAVGNFTVIDAGAYAELLVH